MRFTLKDYQSEAVERLVELLERAQSDYRESRQRSSVSLCATTGAGKTVMSAAVIEALFNGSDEFEFAADEGAVVVWFSDDPALNEQTKNRLREASDKLEWTDLVTIEPPFAKPRLDPGRVYFLNTQKLSVTSKLTRGAREDGDQLVLDATPDDQAWTIWQTLSNTIRDPDLTLYLFLDEAHRGFGTKAPRDKGEAKATIVRRLVNGSTLVEPAPIVVGISATIGKFTTAMSDAEYTQARQVLEPVSVDGDQVQESGLLKDTVMLDFTTETGVFDRALVRRAAEKLRASSQAWREYATAQDDPKALVVPLLVLQIPNRPDPDLVGQALDVIGEVLPEIGAESVRHVLGDHKVQRFGSWDVGWIEPQLVQDRSVVRVLVAKEAISTGWDCPRAEVMVSFRTAKEHDHITQILGRMVRNPLARRIPGDDRLNSVDCLLPHFDRTNAGKVVKLLTGQVTDLPGGGKRVLVDGRETLLNPQLADNEELWAAWRRIKTELLPQRGVQPVSRLLQLATELERDGLLPGACGQAEDEVLRALDANSRMCEPLLPAARAEVEAVHGMSIAGTTGVAKLTYSEFDMPADDQAVYIAYKSATRAFSDVAGVFVDRHVSGVDDELSNPIREAMVEIAALANIPDLRADVDRAANRLFDRWEYQHREAIAALADLRRESYREIKAQAPDPKADSMNKPRVRIEDFSEPDPASADGDGYKSAPLVDRHLTSDGAGMFPLSRLNAWERQVVVAELARPDTVAWYRNPPRSAGDSLCVAYRNEQGNWRGLYPDFIFFQKVDGSLRPSIIDPHRPDLEDALIKLKALAAYATKYGDTFHRIESLAQVGGKTLTLNLQKATVREHVQHWEKSVPALYEKAGEDPDWPQNGQPEPR